MRCSLILLAFLVGCAGALYPSPEVRFGQIRKRCDETPTRRDQGDLLAMTGCDQTTYLLALPCGPDGRATCYDEVTRAVESFAFAHKCDVASLEGKALGMAGCASLGLSGCGARASYQQISGSGWVLEGSPTQTAAEQSRKDREAAEAAAAAQRKSD